MGDFLKLHNELVLFKKILRLTERISPIEHVMFKVIESLKMVGETLIFFINPIGSVSLLRVLFLLYL